MNKRQTKKQLKKKYGINPVSANAVIYDALDRVAKGVKTAIERIVKLMTEFPQSIRSMSEEEYIKLLNNPKINNEQRAMLIKFRTTSSDLAHDPDDSALPMELKERIYRDFDIPKDYIKIRENEMELQYKEFQRINQTTFRIERGDND